MSEFEIRKELQAADPVCGADDKRRKCVARVWIVVGVFAVAVVIAAFIFVGRSSSTVDLAPVEGAKGAPIVPSGMFGGVPSLELGAGASELIGADQKFRSGRDGFVFPNYGGKATNDAIDATTMAALFGKKSVCANPKVAKCVIFPSAQAIAKQLNEAMVVGRCEGMAVLSQRFFDKMETRPAGAGTTNKVTQSQVAKQLGYWWATQVAPEVAASAKSFRSQQPSATALALVKGLKAKAGYTMGLYSKAGGHSVSPIAVTQDGTKRYVYIYDNNYPKEIRRLVIDTATETWTYAGAGVNATSAGAVWKGSGAGSMDLTPMSTRKGPFNVSFGGTKGFKGTAYIVIVTQEGNFTKPVGLKITSGTNVVNTLDSASVIRAQFPIKSFVGRGFGHGAIAYIPTIMAEGSTLMIQALGDSSTGKLKVSIMRTGVAGVVAESASNFTFAVESKSATTSVKLKLPSALDTASVQIANGARAADLQLVKGQGVEVETVFANAGANGSRLIEDVLSNFTVVDLQDNRLFGGSLDQSVKYGQVIITKYSYDSKSGLVVVKDTRTKGVKLDEKFVREIVPSGDAPTEVSHDAPTTTTLTLAKVTVAKANQAALTVTWTSGTHGLRLTTSGGSGSGAVTYMVTRTGTASCTISGSTLLATNTGTCTVTATKASDTNYKSVSSSATSITIAKINVVTTTVTTGKTNQAELALTPNRDSANSGASNVRLTVSGGSGTGALSYTVSDGCLVDWQNYYPVKFTSNKAQNCTVTVTKAADHDYTSATSNIVTVTFK